MTAVLTEREKSRIRRWREGFENDVTLRFATVGHPKDEEFKGFANAMAELAPCVRVKKDGDAAVPLPAAAGSSAAGWSTRPCRKIGSWIRFWQFWPTPMRSSTAFLLKCVSG